MKAFVVTALSALVVGGGSYYYMNSKAIDAGTQAGQGSFPSAGNQTDSDLASESNLASAKSQGSQKAESSPEHQNSSVIRDDVRSPSRVSVPMAQFMEIAKSGGSLKTLEAARTYVKETNGSHAAKNAHLSSLLIAFEDTSLSQENKAHVWQELNETLDKEKADTRSTSQYRLFAHIGFAASEIHFKNDLSKLDAYAKSVDNKASEGYGLFLQAAVANRKGDASIAMSFLETAIQQYPLPEYKRALEELKENPQASPFHFTLSLDDATVQN